MVELTFNEDNRAELHKKIVQKMSEAVNPNLHNHVEQKLVLISELFRLWLTPAGRLFLQTPGVPMKNMRLTILKKIEEFALNPLAHVDAEYLMVAEELKTLVENIEHDRQSADAIAACFAHFA